jgi:hypothetical protein
MFRKIQSMDQSVCVLKLGCHINSTEVRRPVIYMPFLSAFTQFRKVTVCPLICPSLRLSAWDKSAPNGRIFMKFYGWWLVENLSSKFKLHWNLTIITGISHEDLRTFMTTCGRILLRMRNVSNEYHCFTVHFNSLNLTHQLMHFYI